MMTTIAVAVAAVLFVLSIRAVRRHSERATTNAILLAVEDAFHAHERALVRKRMQKFRFDDYGNAVPGEWIKEVLYFLDTVVRPRLEPAANERFQDNLALAIQTLDELVTEAAQESGVLGFDAAMAPADFEHFCADTLREAGWSAQVTKCTGDQGADVIAEREGVRVVLQCKLYRHPVGNKAVQEALAAGVHEGADVAAVVTNSTYTPAAQRLAATTGVRLLHVSDLAYFDAAD